MRNPASPLIGVQAVCARTDTHEHRICSVPVSILRDDSRAEAEHLLSAACGSACLCALRQINQRYLRSLCNACRYNQSFVRPQEALHFNMSAFAASRGSDELLKLTRQACTQPQRVLMR